MEGAFNGGRSQRAFFHGTILSLSPHPSLSSSLHLILSTSSVVCFFLPLFVLLSSTWLVVPPPPPLYPPSCIQTASTAAEWNEELDAARFGRMREIVEAPSPSSPPPPRFSRICASFEHSSSHLPFACSFICFCFFHRHTLTTSTFHHAVPFHAYHSVLMHCSHKLGWKQA
jgi:hypothetical protein